MLTAVRNGIKARFAKPNEPKDTTADYVLDPFTNNNVYFNTGALKRDRLEQIEQLALVLMDAFDLHVE